ncbi:lipid II:glycine glycyltransferase FemX [Leucobacter sp. M11]|uniref:lipid II:glycine glycyltransferase FemX n=1 Tax=Leucobacter sp. M11 TaxID=2993565 RepID=UPI002D80F068|nr:peptidoglycan bridge formation glycyltransferase FemA/FemB family protein [Leucobacter sp. M11]MEB4615889.1 peptidoglycan bridge formation glycyltransferase FemA/FemB family protein [Leucobacter sp. M11]
MSHFLQTDAWAQLQGELGRAVVRDSGDGWRYQAFLERGKLNSRLYCPYGPELDTPGALAPALASLTAQAKRLGAAFVRLEPTGPGAEQDLAAAGLKRVARVQPEHTQRIDLSRPFDELLLDMRKTNRNLHRNYAKKGLTVRQSHDPAEIETLLGLLHGVADQTGMHAHADDYLRTQAKTFLPSGVGTLYFVDLAGDDGEPAQTVASAMIYDDAERRYYAHAAANYEHRKLAPGTIIVSQMIEDAQAKGLREFDLYGVVPPEVTDHAWTGFSEFKRSFGGVQHDFAGTWEKPVKALSYGVYDLARKVVGGGRL